MTCTKVQVFSQTIKNGVQTDQEIDKTSNLQDAICSKDYVLQITIYAKKGIFFAMAKEWLNLPHFQAHMWA